jgi:hypothetical protein
MLTVFITMTPGQLKEFPDCQMTNVRIAVRLNIYAMTCWNPTLEFHKRSYPLSEVTCKLLKNPKYNYYRQLFTAQDEWTVVKYVMQVSQPVRHWTL